MALPTTGPISLGQVKEELNKTGSISLGNSDVRKLAGKATGQISLNDLRGKSSYIWESNLTIGKMSIGVIESIGYARGSNGDLSNKAFLGLTMEAFHISSWNTDRSFVIKFTSNASFSIIDIIVNNIIVHMTKYASSPNMFQSVRNDPNVITLYSYFTSNLNKTIPVYIIKSE